MFFDGGFGYGMEGLLTSILPLAIIIVVVIILAVNGKGRGGPALVLKEFVFNENEDEFLIIRGRAAGFWGWLSSLLSIASITSFICNKQFLKYEAGISHNIPLAHISCVAFGKGKPIGALIAGIIFILAGIIGGVQMGPQIIIIGFLIGGICIIIYARSNNMLFSIYVGENKPLVTFKTKTGTLGGQTVDANNFYLAANALIKAVLAKS
jgi:hypothetical protein